MNDHLNILVVEDNENDAQLMLSICRQAFRDVTPIIAKDFRHAENALETEVVDIVLLDLTLQDVSGEELVRRVRALTDAPIIIITGDVSMDTARKTVWAGADSYLVKGRFHYEELLRVVTMTLGRREAEVQRLQEERAAFGHAAKVCSDCIDATRRNIEKLRTYVAQAEQREANGNQC